MKEAQLSPPPLPRDPQTGHSEGEGGRSARADQEQTNTDVMKPNPEPKPTVVEALVGLLAVMPFLAPKLAGTASASWQLAVVS